MSTVSGRTEPARLEVRHGIEGRGDESATVLAFSGELDFNTLTLAERELESVEAVGPGLLLLDLSALGFMDSSGVRLVLVADQRAQAAGRHVAVRLGDGPPRRVFELLGLVGNLDIR